VNTFSIAPPAPPARRFLVWALPGHSGEPLGRVELVPAVGTYAPEPFAARTLEEVTIPAGCVLRLTVEEVEALS
jgi:hypothetical protein